MNKEVKIDSKRNKSDDKVSGEFISLMLSSSKPPFRTSLTILTKMGGFTYIRIADDLRNEAKSTSLLGLVVIGERLVKLETLVNKNQKFVESDQILFSSVDMYYVSCALIS